MTLALRTVGRTRVSTRRPTWERRERWLASLMALPVIVPFVTFGVLPLIWLIAIGFTDYDGFKRISWVGLANYAEVAGDARWWGSVRNSLILAVGTVAIQVPLGFALALILHGRFRGTTFFRTVFFTPNVVPAAVTGIIVGFLIQPTDSGVFNDLLHNIGLTSSPINFLGDAAAAMVVLILSSAWIEFGFTMVLFLAGLQSIPREIYEAAELDGASSFQRVRFVIFPMLRPIFNVIMLLAIVSVLRSFDIVKSLTNGGPAGATDVMFTHIFNQFFGTSLQPRIGYAASLAVTASLIIAMVVGAYFWAARGRRRGA
jgi:raffinose/stachyose/melibiose transport system permease protein